MYVCISARAIFTYLMDDAFYVKAIEDRKKELLQDTKWITRVLNEVKKVCTNSNFIRCLALGQMSEYINPRFQLALLLIIAKELQITNITAWDPIFTETDVRLLNHYGIQVCEESPEPTPNILWYVPHGPLKLVTELPQQIGSGVYLGNDLAKFDTSSESLLQFRDTTRIFNIEPSNKDRWYPAFNATAIHSKAEDSSE